MNRQTWARRMRRALRRKRQIDFVKRYVDRFFDWAVCVLWPDCTFKKNGWLHVMAMVAEVECSVCMFGRGWVAGLAVGDITGAVLALAVVAAFG